MDLTNLNNERNKRRKPSLDLGNMVFGKVPPQAKELEEAILGGIMIEKLAFGKVFEILKEFCFYTEANQRIFKAMRMLSDKTIPIDLLTVVEQLKINEELEIVGGPYYVSKLTNSVVSAANIEAHSRIVLQKYIQREVIRVSGEAIGEAYEDSTDVFDLLNNTTDAIRKINETIEEGNNINIPNEAMNVVKALEDKVGYARTDTEDPNLILTGHRNWDKINGQLFNGLYVIAARPGMGKGNDMTELICRMGKRYDIGVVNGEMTTKQLLIRLGCNLLNIDNYLWKKEPKYITDEEIQKVYDAMEEAQKLKLQISDNTYIDKVCNKIRLWVEKNKVRVVFIDFLTLLKIPDGSSRRFSNKREEINYIMDKLRLLCKDLGIPIFLYAQLSRELYKRANKEPNLSDLKESGNIEEYAFQVCFLHRPEYYDGANEFDEFGESTKGLMYRIIAKHRDGELERLKHRHLPQFSKVEDWDNFIPVVNEKDNEPLPF